MNTAEPSPSFFARLLGTLKQMRWSQFFRELITGNPFYMLSAGMMLYGIYLVSVDPQMSGEEASQLAFNFSSLQLYEVLLIVTAIFLARRSIWYDATMLVTLENLFVLVPFILVSQAALLDRKLTFTICVAGVAFAVGKFWGLRRYLQELTLPPRLLIFGAGLLLLNLAFPLFFRKGINFENEAWTDLKPYLWYAVLPGLLCIANVLPRPRHWGGLALQRSWLPQLFFFLWLGVTAVHIASIDYVDNQKFHYYQLAPLLWAAAWTAYNRRSDFVAEPSETCRSLLFGLPVAVTVLAMFYKDAVMFAALTAINVVIYGGLLAVRHERRMAYHLFLISLTALAAAMPESWGRYLIPAFTREKSIVLSVAAYILFQVSLARQSKHCIAGAIIVGLGTVYQFNGMDYAEQFAMQNALLYLLLHSLRWTDEGTLGARPLRLAAACVWVVHSFAWGYIGGLGVAAPIALASLLVMGLYYLVYRLEGRRPTLTVFHAAWLSFATVPVNFVIETLRITPKGYLTVLGSFILFAIGTAFALTKDRWSIPRNEIKPSPAPTELPPVGDQGIA